MLYFRIAALVLWAAVAFIMAPSFYRYVSGISDEVVEYRTAFFFTGLLFVGMQARWLIAPDEQTVFLSLTALGAVLALYVAILAVQGRRRK